jgi:hypothetical protein
MSRDRPPTHSNRGLSGLWIGLLAVLILLGSLAGLLYYAHQRSEPLGFADYTILGPNCGPSEIYFLFDSPPRIDTIGPFQIVHRRLGD